MKARLSSAWLWSFCVALVVLWGCGSSNNPPDAGDAGDAAAETTSGDVGVKDSTLPDSTTAQDSTFAPDSSQDTSLPDTSVPDSEMPDTSMPDTSMPDSEMPDTAPADATGFETSPPPGFTVSFTVIGLAAGASVVVVDNGGDAVTATSNGSYMFSMQLGAGVAYDVTVGTQPTTQVCTVTNGMGVIVDSNVSAILVNCSGTIFIGGAVQGLAPNDTVVLQENGGDNLSVSQNGPFAFTMGVAPGSMYTVTVLTQPGTPAQVCTVTNASGTANATVTNVLVSCMTPTPDSGPPTYTIGGTVTGLAPNNTIVLANNGGNNDTVTTNGTFAFSTALASGAPYLVTIATPPKNPPQTCTVSAGMGTVGSANVTNIVVNCSTTMYTLGGTVSGLAPNDSVQLAATGGNAIFVSSTGSFAFPNPLPQGTMYTVTVAASPSAPVAQTCTVANATGTIGNANVTNVAVTCTTNSYTIGGAVSGLVTGGSVTLVDNGTAQVAVTANGTFVFTTSVLSGSTYKVTIGTNPTYPPAAQVCAITNATGTVGNANVVNVSVICAPPTTFMVGGTISGLAAGDTVTLSDNGGNQNFTSNGHPTQMFNFNAKVASGQTYSVAVVTSPGSPIAQTCTVNTGTGSGTVQNGDVTTVAITCTTNTYTIGGTVMGLATGDNLVAEDNNDATDAVTATTTNPSFTFTVKIASGAAYSVTVANPTSPTPQTCTVTGGSNNNGTGTVLNADVSVTVTCADSCTGLCSPNPTTCPPPNECVSGDDPETAAPWVICSSTCDSVWISTTDGTGMESYHAQQICQSLGYNFLNVYGTTCGNVCGNACGEECDGSGTGTGTGTGGGGGGNTCSEPGDEFFNGCNSVNVDANGTVISGTEESTGVMWQCTAQPT